jgi:methylenetetrahydrofolate reductase (NADPH)
MSSFAAALLVMRSGLDPILQITCRDRNRIALQGDLLGAAALGIRNVLALGGDPVEAGDEPDARPVFDLSTRQLLAAMRDMTRDGLTMTGRKLETRADFYPGAAALVMEPNVSRDPQVLTGKLNAGARFVQTQFCFDTDRLRRYMSWLGDNGLSEKMHFLIGVGPLRSARSARWMRDKLHGTAMPEKIVARMETADDEVSEGISICAELIAEYREIPGVAGVHLMAPRNLDAIPRVLSAAGIDLIA